MEILCERISSKLMIPDEIFSKLKTIITADSNTLMVDTFKEFISLKDSHFSQVYYHFCAFLIYNLDLHHCFKADLLNLMKRNKQIYIDVCKQFYTICCFDNVNLENIQLLRYKLTLVNNTYDTFKNVLSSKDANISQHDMEMFFNEVYSIITTEFSIHLRNVNEEIFQKLINLVSNAAYISKRIDPSVNEQKFIEMNEVLKSELFKHLEMLEMGSFHKDFELTFSNLVFSVIRILSKEDYVKSSIDVLSHFVNSSYSNHLLVYIKSFLMNSDIEENLNFLRFFISQDFPALNQFIVKNINIDIDINININITQQHLQDSSSIGNFYMLFLDNDLISNYSMLINEIFLVFIQKIINSESSLLIAALDDFIYSSDIVPRIFTKMSNDKKNFHILDEGYCSIIEWLYKLSPRVQGIIEYHAGLYLNAIISSNSRILIIEAKLWRFITDLNLETRKAFLIFILGKPFDKRNLPLLSEYIKIVFDEFFKCTASEMEKYQQFIDIFPEPFLKFLFSVNCKDLKYFANLLINLEKHNKNLYAILISQCYERLFKTTNDPKIDTIKKYSILLTLLKPFRSHKRALFIKSESVQFFIVIIDKQLEVNFSIPIKELKTLAKASDRHLVLNLIEFLNAFDSYENVFQVIKTMIKYNSKSSYSEFKNGTIKALKVYFGDYAQKIITTLSKGKLSANDMKFMSTTVDNFDYLFHFLSDNIYDRPVENLLVYLELLQMNIENIDHVLANVKINTQHDIFEKLKEKYFACVFEKGLCTSLISLLRHSWYYVRMSALAILKNPKFASILIEMKSVLYKEIQLYMFSLRQMDAEGSSNVFLLLLHHMKSEFIEHFFQKELSYTTNITISNNNIQSIYIFHQIIKEKLSLYIEYLTSSSSEYSPEIKDISIHSYFIFIKNLIEAEKDSIFHEDLNTTLNILLDLGEDLIKLNQNFVKFLVNNGVGEFSIGNSEIEGSEECIGDNEDKRLISLWCSTKYSAECFNLILDLMSSYYKLISRSDQYPKLLVCLENFLHSVAELVIQYKHMGAVKSFNESLLKIASLLNKSEEAFKDYRELAFKKLKDFIDTQLVQDDLSVSNILRRSAGIPYLITSLIRSYITQDRVSVFSQNKILDILKYTVNSLLESYRKYQSINSDVSVHCLHVIRVVSDDTMIKPYIKEFYSLIIIQILDGLENENWSIKNSCMLLFSRLIKNNFLLNLKSDDRNLPSVMEYLSNKEEFKNKVIALLLKHCASQSLEINDCLMLILTFFTKFRESKLSEINNEALVQLIEILFSLAGKNNKIFRKLLCNAIYKFYGENYIKSLEKIEGILDNLLISEGNKNINININNLIDFIYNVIVSYLEKSESRTGETALVLVMKKIKEVICENTSDNNLIAKSKYIQLLRKLGGEISQFIDIYDYTQLGVRISDKTIDMDILMKSVEKNSRVPYYYKFTKHSLALLGTLGFHLINVLPLSNVVSKKNQELLRFLLKTSKCHISPFYSIENISQEIIENNILSSINVNISTRLLDCLDSQMKEALKDMKDYDLFSEKLIQELIGVVRVNREKTKLICRLLKLIAKLFHFTQSTTTSGLQSFLEIIHEYSSSFNEEKLRIHSAQGFEALIRHFTFNSDNENFLLILKIINQIMNDEHPEIRTMACSIFQYFNKSSNLIVLKPDFVCSNEYLNKKLLTIDISQCNDMKKCQGISSFYSYLMKENFYFLESKALLNNETKVFYYEPENRYVDNIENKIILARALLQRKWIWKETKDNVTQIPNKTNMNILVMLELFTEFIRISMEEIVKYLEQLALPENPKFVFGLIRPYLYKF